MAKRSNKSAEQMVVDNQYFATFWTHKVEALTDVCRQLQAEGSVGSGFPSIFLTIAPSEWNFPIHRGMLEWCAKAKLLSNSHSLLTLHIYNALTSVLQAVFKDQVLLDDWGIKTIFEFAIRIEFQKRGTPHAHVIIWAASHEGRDMAHLSGRSGEDHTSPMVTWFEKTFSCGAVDIQTEQGSALLLRYVAGHLSKASDALHYTPQDKTAPSKTSAAIWRTVFRLLSRKGFHRARNGCGVCILASGGQQLHFNGGVCPCAWEPCGEQQPTIVCSLLVTERHQGADLCGMG